MLHAISALVSHLRGRVSERSLHGAPDRNPACADVFESYHFGIFILHPLNWLARGLISLLNAFLGGTFGVEGGVLELSFLALPLLSRSFGFSSKRSRPSSCARSPRA